MATEGRAAATVGVRRNEDGAVRRPTEEMRMDIHLQHLTPQDHLRLFIDETLVDEIAVGLCDPRPHLEAEVRAARCLQALAGWVRRLPGLVENLEHLHDGCHAKPEARQGACLRGLRDGMAGTTRPHPTEAFLPGLPPEDCPSYLVGYRAGEGGRRALTQIPEEPPAGRDPLLDDPFLQMDQGGGRHVPVPVVTMTDAQLDAQDAFMAAHGATAWAWCKTFVRWIRPRLHAHD